MYVYKLISVRRWRPFLRFKMGFKENHKQEIWLQRPRHFGAAVRAKQGGRVICVGDDKSEGKWHPWGTSQREAFALILGSPHSRLPKLPEVLSLCCQTEPQPKAEKGHVSEQALNESSKRLLPLHVYTTQAAFWVPVHACAFLHCHHWM